MCGVIGYIGKSGTPEMLYNGLKRLEYRGYDSAGIAVFNNQESYIIKAEGKLHNLEKKLNQIPKTFNLGIGHTRWATHGKPSEENSHPHASHKFILLHNGIIENYRPIKDLLITKGYVFASETDSEVAAHLLDHEYKKLSTQKNPVERVKQAIISLVNQIHGTFAFAIICHDTPDHLFVVKYASPLVVGLKENETFVASGINALIEHTKNIIVLEDNDIGILSQKGLEVIDFNNIPKTRNPLKVEWSHDLLSKNGFDHYMLKEINETPYAVAQTLVDRVNRETGEIILENLGIKNLDLNKVNRIQILACGTSFYASLIGKFCIEKFTRIPVEVEISSESKYRTSTVNENTLTIAVSQSGETIDTLQAIKHSKDHGAMSLGIINVPGSTIGFNCNAEILLRAGPEVGVASTKAFSAQVSTFMILAIALAQSKNKSSTELNLKLIEELFLVPGYIEKCLALSPEIKNISSLFKNMTSVLYIGRGMQWPVALEGALKLKELSYIHAEGYPAGELKHGPLALVDEHMTVICICPKDSYYEKTLSNIQEIKARKGNILAIGTENDPILKELSDGYIGVPDVSELVQPFVTTAVLHMLAYWVALVKGNDVDQPRNLAKSVTVE